ncbi:serine/threonine-protein phosphatase 6 regulatory ankyrin repeat subunit B-like [Dysidea avara]|uniref:serine/threonine-protein phosphatase 6 regulatory ankyrin repeat subunit B-like n=1 Tax=Dysidea avara TaxID=196820 RepID=UPI0033247653
MADYGSNSGETPLHVVCISGQSQIIQLLFSYVSDLDATDNEGQTPTHYAAEILCLNLLCNQGADICTEDKYERTAIHLAATRNYCDVIQFLLERGMELDGLDFEGRNSAHYAAACGNLECLKLLVDNAVDILSDDNKGDQPVHDAAKNNHLPCLKYLLKKGAKLVAANNHQRGLLHKINMTLGQTNAKNGQKLSDCNFRH